MLERLPMLQPRLVGVLTDRVRGTKCRIRPKKWRRWARFRRAWRMSSTIPAAAARRAAGSLREAFQTFREAAARLDEHRLSAEQRAAVPAVERELAERAAATANLDSLERSDCEEAVAACLERHGVARAWELAPALVDAGCEAAWFERVYRAIPRGGAGRSACAHRRFADHRRPSEGNRKLQRPYFRAGPRDQRVHLHGPGTRAGGRHPPWSRKHAAACCGTA